MTIVEPRYGARERGLFLIPSVVVLLAAVFTLVNGAGLLGYAFALGWAQLPGL
jgi:hypothetical protein